MDELKQKILQCLAAQGGAGIYCPKIADAVTGRKPHEPIRMVEDLQRRATVSPVLIDLVLSGEVYRDPKTGLYYITEQGKAALNKTQREARHAVVSA
jgi:predicted transcriptional regulator with HTH domain